MWVTPGAATPLTIRRKEKIKGWLQNSKEPGNGASVSGRSGKFSSTLSLRSVVSARFNDVNLRDVGGVIAGVLAVTEVTDRAASATHAQEGYLESDGAGKLEAGANPRAPGPACTPDDHGRAAAGLPRPSVASGESKEKYSDVGGYNLVHFLCNLDGSGGTGVLRR